jgi:hypothetical protein
MKGSSHVLQRAEHRGVVYKDPFAVIFHFPLARYASDSRKIVGKLLVRQLRSGSRGCSVASGRVHSSEDPLWDRSEAEGVSRNTHGTTCQRTAFRETWREMVRIDHSEASSFARLNIYILRSHRLRISSLVCFMLGRSNVANPVLLPEGAEALRIAKQTPLVA